MPKVCSFIIACSRFCNIIAVTGLFQSTSECFGWVSHSITQSVIEVINLRLAIQLVSQPTSLLVRRLDDHPVRRSIGQMVAYWYFTLTSHIACYSDGLAMQWSVGCSNGFANHPVGCSDGSANHPVGCSNGFASQLVGYSDVSASHLAGCSDGSANHLVGCSDGSDNHLVGCSNGSASHLVGCLNV